MREEVKKGRRLVCVILKRWNVIAWLVVAAFWCSNNQSGNLFMCKDEVFKEVLQTVCDVTGLSEHDVLYCKTEECTDARFLLVKYLWRLMPCVSIGKLISRTRQGVNAILQREKGDSWLMERNWKEIVKRLESKGF